MAETTPASRTRVVTWQDPQMRRAAMEGTSRLAFLEASVCGAVPPAPVYALTGVEFVEVARGRAAFELEPAEYHYGPGGTVHGGLVSLLFDAAIGAAVNSMGEPDTGFVTLELKVNFVWAVTIETGRVRCDAEVLYEGGAGRHRPSTPHRHGRQALRSRRRHLHGHAAPTDPDPLAPRQPDDESGEEM